MFAVKEELRDLSGRPEPSSQFLVDGCMHCNVPLLKHDTCALEDLEYILTSKVCVLHCLYARYIDNQLAATLLPSLAFMLDGQGRKKYGKFV